MTRSAIDAPATKQGTNHWTVAAFALAGLGLSMLLFSLLGPTYEAETLVAVSNPPTTVHDEILNVTNPTILEAAAVELGFRPQISVTAAEVARLLTITASDSNPERAAAAANTVAEMYTDARLGAAASVAREAQPPTEATGLGALMFALLGSLLGMGAGMASAPFLRLRNEHMVMHEPAVPKPTTRPDERTSARPNAFASAVNGPSAGPDVAEPIVDLRQHVCREVSVAQQRVPVLAGASASASRNGVHVHAGDRHLPVAVDAAIAMGVSHRPSLSSRPIRPIDQKTPASMSSDIPRPSKSTTQIPPAGRTDFVGLGSDQPERPRMFRLEDDRVDAPVFDRRRTRNRGARFFRPDANDDFSSAETSPAFTSDETPGSEADPTAPPEPRAIAEPRWAESADTAPTAESNRPNPVSQNVPGPQPPPTTSTSPEPTSTDPVNRAETADELVPSGISRRDHDVQLDALRAELVLSHAENVARLRSEHERVANDLRTEVSRLTRQLRFQAASLTNRAEPDQGRVGDLEAQVDALEIELAQLRQTLESERIGHAKKITDERGAADRALDNARRQHREELAKYLHNHRQALAEYRNELDGELMQARAHHAVALERQHLDYEAQLEAERNRVETTLRSVAERHERELEAARGAGRNELSRQAAQYKATIAQLRVVSEAAEDRVSELEKATRMLRAELGTQQKQARHAETDHAAAMQRATDELATAKRELEAERERNAALRADVLRRSAESHNAVDQAVAERTAQLAELEASVARQRQYADTRVREISEAAEEQAHHAATREAELTATISRLKRELAASQQASADGPPAGDHSADAGQV